MPDYKKMYFLLFNEISKTIEQLQVAQQKAEELYINSEDIPPKLLNTEDEEGSLHKIKKLNKLGQANCDTKRP